MRNIREHFEAFGYDMRDITDDEIRAGVRRFGEVVLASQVTTTQVATAWAQAFGSPQQTEPKTWNWSAETTQGTPPKSRLAE